MAGKELEKLYYTIEARTSKLEADVTRAKGVVSGFSSSASTALKGIGFAAVAIGAAQLLKEVVKLGDAYTTLQGRLKLVTTGSNELARVQAELFRIAQNSQQSLESVADLYSRLARASKELGSTQAETIKFTEGVAAALKVSNTEASQTSSAMLQLGQALGAPIVQAQEYNAILDSAPRLLQAVADGWGKAGISLGQLTRLVKSGQVSNTEFFQAFLKGSGTVQAEADSMAVTTTGAMTQMKNSILLMAGEFDKAAGITATLAHLLVELSKATDKNESVATRAGDAFHIFGLRLKELAGISYNATGVLKDTFRAIFEMLTLDSDGTTQALTRVGVAMDALSKHAKNFNSLDFGKKLAPKGPLQDFLNDGGFQKFGGGGKVAPPVDVEAAKKAAKALADVRKELDGILGSFTDASPVTRFAQQMEDFEKAAKSAKLPAKELATSLQLLNTIFEQVKDAAIEDAAKSLDALAASMTLTAVDDLNAAVAAQVAELRKLGDAQVDAADGNQELAARYYASADAVAAQGKQLATATAALEAFDKAQTAITDAPANGFGGFTRQLDLLAEVNILKATRDQLTDKKAIALVDARIRDINHQIFTDRDGANGATDNTVKKASEWADQLQNIVGIAQLIGSTLEAAGKGFGRSITQAATGLQSVIAGAKGLASAGKDKDGKALSGVASVASYAGPVGAIVGGFISIGSALATFGDKARQRALELHASAAAFNRALSEFTIIDRTALEDAIRNNLKQANSVALAAGEKTGIQYNVAPDFQSAAQIKEQATGARETAASLSGIGNKNAKVAAANLIAFAAALDLIAAETLKNEEKLKIAHAAEVLRATQDLKVRALVSRGDTAGAAALRLHYEQQREMAAALLDATESGKAYAATLRDIQAGELSAAAAIRAEANANRILTNEIKVNGLTGRDALSAIIDTAKSLFTEIGAAVDGLDLSTQGGMDALKQRGQQLFAKFTADGAISDDEQKILDSFYNIYDTAADVFDSLSERIGRSLSKLDTDNAILGGDAKTQLGRTSSAARGFNDVLDQILASADIGTSAGAGALRTQLRAFYESLAEDADPALVGLIKSLLGNVDSAITEGQQAADAKIAEGVAKRSKARDTAGRANAVGDTEGADAFDTTLRAYTKGFRQLFNVFDVRTLDGITGAKDRLKQLNASIDGLTDDQIMAQFGMTRDELIDAVLALDTSFDSLATGAQSAAQSMADAAKQLHDLTDDVDQSFLRSSGQGQQADINDVNARVDKKVQDAKDLGASQAVIDKIVQTGVLDIAAINQRYNEQATTAIESANRDTIGTSTSAKSKTEFATSTVTPVTQAQTLRMVDTLASSLVVQREQLALFRAAFGGGLPTLRTPALPQGLGGFSNSTTSGGSVFNITIQVAGNLSSSATTRELVRTILPELSAEMRRVSSGLGATVGISA